MIENIFSAVQQFLLQPTFLIGILVAIGYGIQKKSFVKTFTGTISAMVGLNLIIFGGSQFTAIFKPIVDAVSEVHGIKGYLMDPYAMRAATLEGLGDLVGYSAYVFVLGFFVNLILVYLGKYTKARGIFLTGNTGLAHSQAVLWLVIYWFGVNAVTATVIAGIILGIYWAISTTLPIKVIDEVTDGGGFTIGHNQNFGLWFFGKLSPLYGKKGRDADKMNLPGWLGIFDHNITAVAVIMTVFAGGFLLTIGPANIESMLSQGQNWLVYIVGIGLNFSMYMVILLQGVRMLVGEITGSFTGIQEKFIPNAVPAVDVAALLPYSANAATLGFIFTTFGTLLGMGLLYLTGSSIMVIPGFVPLFFAGGPIGVISNKFGGLKAVFINSILLGLIHVFGSVWAINLSGLPEGVGWTGMFDWATVWPMITQIFKWIAQIFNLGPFSLR